MGHLVRLTGQTEAMKSYKLEHDEFAALVRFLNAKSLIGMDDKLFPDISERDLERILQKLQRNGWLVPADRPGTWHVNEDLMESLAVTVAPEFVGMARPRDRSKSILFYLKSDQVTVVVVTDQHIVLADLDTLEEMAKQVVEFLDSVRPAELIVARVENESLASASRVIVDEKGALTAEPAELLAGDQNQWNTKTMLEFIKAALADLKSGNQG
jgi:hypothetical protein